MRTRKVVAAVGAVVRRLVRDWPVQRRINRARAGDYGDQVATRKQVCRILVDGIASGQYRLRPEHIDDLITKDTVDAFRALGTVASMSVSLTSQLRADCAALIREAALTAMRESLEATEVIATQLAAARKSRPPLTVPSATRPAGHLRPRA